MIFRTKINRYSIFDAERMVLERKIILLFVSIGRGWREGREKEEPFKYRVASGNKEVQLRFIIAPALRFVSPGFNAKFIVDREVRWEENQRQLVARWIPFDRISLPFSLRLNFLEINCVHSLVNWFISNYNLLAK